LIRLKVDHLPGGGDPLPVWLWSSKTGMSSTDVDLRWQAFLEALRPGAHLQNGEADAWLDTPEAPQPRGRRPLDVADHHPMPRS
jgi:hypothetical protein